MRKNVAIAHFLYHFHNVFQITNIIFCVFSEMVLRDFKNDIHRKKANTVKMGNRSEYNLGERKKKISKIFLMDSS